MLREKTVQNSPEFIEVHRNVIRFRLPLSAIIASSLILNSQLSLFYGPALFLWYPANFRQKLPLTEKRNKVFARRRNDDEKCVIISPWREIKLRFSVTFTGARPELFFSLLYVSSHTERKSKGHKSHDYLITMTAKSTQNKQLENGKFSLANPEFIVPFFTQHTHNIFTDFSFSLL